MSPPHIYIHTRNYALAIASASFPPGSHGNTLGITLGSRISKPKVMILDPKILVFFVFLRFSTFLHILRQEKKSDGSRKQTPLWKRTLGGSMRLLKPPRDPEGIPRAPPGNPPGIPGDPPGIPPGSLGTPWGTPRFPP